MTALYTNPDDPERQFTAEELTKLDTSLQFVVMRKWFLQNYEEPEESLPHSSEDGGFFYIWGGPYDAREVLNDEFGSIVGDDVIQELAHDLTLRSPDWSPVPDPADIAWWDDDASEHFSAFQSTVQDVQALLTSGQSMSPGPRSCLHRVLYVHIITAMETYLADAFKSTILSSPSHLRLFIETTPAFQSEKKPISEVFSLYENIERTAKKYLNDLVWHKLDVVKLMYKAVLDIELPGDLRSLLQAVAARHDLVHRGGKNKDDQPIDIGDHAVNELGIEVLTFISVLDGRIIDLIKKIGGGRKHEPFTVTTRHTRKYKFE